MAVSLPPLFCRLSAGWGMNRSAMSLDLPASLSRPNVIREDLPKHHLVIIKVNIPDNHRKEYLKKRKRNHKGKKTSAAGGGASLETGDALSPTRQTSIGRETQGPVKGFEQQTPAVTHRNCEGTVRTQNGGLPQVPTQELVDHSRDGRTGWAMAQYAGPSYESPPSFLALCGTDYYRIGHAYS